MEDDDLAAIRNKRMQELQQQMKDPNSQQRQEQAKKQEAEMVNSLLAQILTQDARARLNSIALVKPEKAKKIEAMLISMARARQLSEKMDENQLVEFLGKMSGGSQRTTVKFERRRVMDSDSD